MFYGGEVVGGASGVTVTASIQEFTSLTRQDDTFFHAVALVGNVGPVVIYRAGSINPVNVLGYIFPGGSARIPLPTGSNTFYFAGTDNDYIAVHLVR